MAKKQNISQIIIKILLSASIFQLMLICFVLVPSECCISAHMALLKAYIPEMTEYAVLTALLSIPIGVITERLLGK